jgi:P27 family predicted phage terminase small subunit
VPIRKPRALKVLDGQSPVEINHDEPSPLSEDPVMPDWFTPAQAEKWEHTTRQLRGMRMLNAADTETIVSYVVSTEMVAQIGAAMVGESLTVVGGHGSVYADPRLTILNQAMARSIRLARELGLTPQSRASLRMSTLTPDTEASVNTPANFFSQAG